MLVCTSETLSFAKEGNKFEKILLRRTIYGKLKSILTHCHFKIAKAREKIFKLFENTWAMYSVGTISTNEVCPAANDTTEMQIQ